MTLSKHYMAGVVIMKKLFNILVLSLFCLGSYSAFASGTDKGPDSGSYSDEHKTKTMETASSVDPIKKDAGTKEDEKPKAKAIDDVS